MPNNFFSDETINAHIKTFLDVRLASYGISQYACAVMSKRNTSQISVITSCQGEWLDSYLEQKCQNIDPVVITALNKVAPFSWDENISIGNQWHLPKSKRFKESLVFKIAENYNVFRGYTFVLHDCENNLVTLSLMLDRLINSEIEVRINENQGPLQLLLATTHDTLLTAYRKKTKHNESDEKKALSRRQLDILYLCSQGKTYPEVSAVLGITVSTVKFHMGDAVKKLGVKNAKHAISLSIELDLARGYDYSGKW